MKLSKSEIVKRWGSYQKVLIDENIDGLIISSPEHIYYLTGYVFVRENDREAFVLINSNAVVLVLHRMYAGYGQVFNSLIKIEIAKESIFKTVLNLCSGKKIGIEETNLTVLEGHYLEKNKIKLINIAKSISKLRSIKSDKETDIIKKIELITQNALLEAIKWIKAGITEREVADYFYKQLKFDGVYELAFPTIVASGKNSGVPHHNTSDRKIETNDIVMIDCGGKKEKYCADITRTIVCGKQDQKFRDIYQIVQQAQENALDQICHGAKIANIDLAVREVFGKAGLIDHFWHTTGHGLGIGIHEYPSLHYKAEGVLQSGMIITVEPGLYFDWGGVRIEDVVLVTHNGFEPISQIGYAK